MTSEIKEELENEVKQVKTKNPKRVAAGKKSVEARLRNAEARKKESERLRKENLKLKEITKVDDDDEETEEIKEIKVNKNYIPICLTIIGVVGAGIYFYNKKPPIKSPPVIQRIEPKKEIDPFEFN